MKVKFPLGAYGSMTKCLWWRKANSRSERRDWCGFRGPKFDMQAAWEVICLSPFDTNLQRKASLSRSNAVFIFSRFYLAYCRTWLHVEPVMSHDQYPLFTMTHWKWSFLNRREDYLSGFYSTLAVLPHQKRLLKFIKALLIRLLCSSVFISIRLQRLISAPVNSRSKAWVNVFIRLALM